MSTKKFQVSTNRKVLEDATFTCSTRKEAIKYITDALETNSSLNPQDFILEEIEEKSDLELVAEKVAKCLTIAENAPSITIREITPTDKAPFMMATLTRPQAHYLPLTSSTLKAMVEILDGWNWWIDPENRIEISAKD